ncbi:uncharacterized protein VICG_01298 [Vittaforma corneae ATCC 50505]|uniref:FAR-17a/AIG1-like protein n=1 Tax=Vittaforma corneae (strain ATCC 50505) TaxID=993615 RepID=L2GMF6_VITCO|nr:uncharacterized protein VICG_01298 [Vittaforma corneae ATCC 50505]ELA41665.1 hypothetical protein VICG_01298 [Vittaforma corneae ATCC 50505]
MFIAINPSQILTGMNPKQRFIVSLTRSFLILTSIFSLFDYVENPNSIKSTSEYNNYKYLLFTKISLLLTIISAISGIINRITGNFHFIKNFFLPVSFTFEFIVTFIYWLLFLIDKKLIVDKETLKPGNETPLLSRLSSHVFPLILSYIEYTDFTLKPCDYHLMFFVLFAMLYYILVTAYATYFGRYIYPFLDNLGFYQRLLFFAGIATVGICIYSAQYKIFRNRKPAH